MRIEYFPDTDSLYIDLAERAGVDAREIGDGVVIDLDADGHPVGIDIDQASKHLDLRTLDLRRFPLGAEKTAGGRRAVLTTRGNPLEAQDPRHAHAGAHRVLGRDPRRGWYTLSGGSGRPRRPRRRIGTDRAR